MSLKFFLILFVLFFGLASAWAANDSPVGKVLSTEGDKVKIEVIGEMPSWARKGGYLRAVASDGKLILRGAKILNIDKGVIEASSSKVKDLKIGDQYTLGKGKATAGC